MRQQNREYASSEFQDGIRAGITQIEEAVTVSVSAKGTGGESVTALHGLSAHDTAEAVNVSVSTLDEALTGLAAIKTLVENAHAQDATLVAVGSAEPGDRASVAVAVIMLRGGTLDACA